MGPVIVQEMKSIAAAIETAGATGASVPERLLAAYAAVSRVASAGVDADAAAALVAVHLVALVGPEKARRFLEQAVAAERARTSRQP